jgi:translocation and assembly module TamB
MAGAFRLAGDLVYVDSLVALSDGGPIRADGIVGIETLTEPELDLEVTAREALVMNNERGKVRANVGVDVEGPLDALVMVGDVHVEDGEISVPEADQHRRTTRLDDPLVLGVLDTLGIDAPLTPGMKILENMRADLEVRIERDTWLRNSDLNLEVFTPTDGQPLRVSTAQGARTLVLEGVIHTDRGEYDFAGRSLKISTGSVSFLGLDHPDPLLQLSAQHEVPRPGRQTLMILINVGGYLSRPRLSLSSNSEPPLPESDLLSYLAFGRESGSLLASEGSGILGDAIGGLGVLAEQQLAGLFVGALSDALFSTIEEDITEKGVDVFRVRPTALPDELNFGGNLDNFLQGIEIEAGEYWGPFYVATTVRPILQSAPGLWAEYRTASGFSWTTAWQPRYLPLDPTLEPVIARPTRVLSTFFLWQKRF